MLYEYARQHMAAVAEAEVREILNAALVPSRRILLGDALATLGHDLNLTDDDVATLDEVRDRTPDEVRDRTPAEPLTFQ